MSYTEDRSKNSIPTTAKEAFEQLDAMLSDEDKKHLVKDEVAVIDAHFSIGLWIRNNWLYPLQYEEKQTFMNMFAEDSELPRGFLTIHPDMESSAIIEKC